MSLKIMIPQDSYINSYQNLISYYPITCHELISQFCHVYEIYNVPQMSPTASCMIFSYWHYMHKTLKFKLLKKMICQCCVHHERYDTIKCIAAIILQQYWKYYQKKQKAARIIQRGLYNWLWKPICKDGTYGINLRIGFQMLSKIQSNSKLCCK